MPAQGLVVFRVDAEGQVLELLRPAAGVDRAPAMRMAVGMEIDAAADLANIQPEGGIVRLCRAQIRHAEDEPIQGMDRCHSLTPGTAQGLLPLALLES